MEAKQVYDNSIDKWNRNKGIGTLSYDSTLDLFVPIKIILNKYYARNPNSLVIVVVANNARKEEWSTKLLTGFNYFDKIGNDLLKFVTADDIILNKLNKTVELIIFDQIDRFNTGERLEIVKGKYIKYKYIVGLTNSPDPYEDTFGLYDACPVVDRVTKVDVITHGLLDGIVEYNIPVTMNSNDKVLYEECNKFIQTTLEIFNNDFNLALNCYHGDKVAGISADYFRNELAASKGWNQDIDISNAYYANIDRFYNPNVLYERSKTFSTIIRERKELLSDNASKIALILKLVELNKTKKILIISKRSEFANKIAKAINDKIEGKDLKKDMPQTTLFTQDKIDAFTVKSSSMCVEYHPDVESRPLIDIDTNDYIRYKSGANSGKVKTFGATSLNKIANERFNEGYHNVISSTNAIPKETDLIIDFIIITSPECNTLSQFQYRVNRLQFKENVKIVNIYLSNTKEYDKLKELQGLNTNKIVNIENNQLETLNL